MWVTTSMENTKYLVSKTVDQPESNYWLFNKHSEWCSRPLGFTFCWLISSLQHLHVKCEIC